MEPLVILVVLVLFGLWCLRGLWSGIPGSGLLSSLGSKLFDTAFNREKQSGAHFQKERETSEWLNARNRGLILDGAGQKRLSEETSFQHVAVISPTGAGKTTRYIAPNLLTLDDCSVIVTDPSGELYAKTSGAMASRGFAVEVLNLADPVRSLGYNPLSKLESHGDIDKLSHVLMRSANPVVKPGDEIWYSEPQNLMAILIRCLRNTGEPEWINLHNLLFLLQNFGRDGRPLIRFIARYAPDEATVQQFKGFVSGNDKMLSSFLTMGRNALRALNNPDIASLLARDELDFQRLRKRKTALYLVVPETEAEVYGFILNLFYIQFFAAQKSLEFTSDGLPIHVLYDEFGHSMIPGFDTVATTIRKYRVSLSIILQDFGQLRERYGDHAAKTILSGGMRTKLFYPGLDVETSRMVEEMLGRVQFETKQGRHKSVREENLLNADRVRRMEKDQAICVTASQEPVILKTTACYEESRMKKLMELPPCPFPAPLPSSELRFVSLT
ncbi:MAG: type IV secretory system conjugative DNA transfer family protein [Verrucomicrobiae bacterium]|nr:type IV secretory system conjugative DNA transfer family protein [Verrucomicrobiae bacterium]